MAVSSSNDQALEETTLKRISSLRRESVRLALLLVGPPESGYPDADATREDDLLDATSADAPSVLPEPV